MMANRAALDGLKRDLEKTKNKEIESIKVVHSEEKGMIFSRLKRFLNVPDDPKKIHELDHK